MSVPISPTGYAADLPPIVGTDAPCRTCSYNLRGLPVNGNCPECGQNVANSLRGDLLKFSDLVWLGTLRNGVRVLSWGLILLLFGVFVMRSFWLIGFTTSIAALLALTLGYWWMTKPDPSGIGEDVYGLARKVIRITLGLWILGRLFVFTAVFSPASWGMLFISNIAAIIGSIGLLISFPTQLYYLKYLTLRLPDYACSRRANYLMYGLSGSIFLFALLVLAVVVMPSLQSQAYRGIFSFATVCFALTVLIHLIIYILLLNRISKRLHVEKTTALQLQSGIAQTEALPPLAH